MISKEWIVKNVYRDPHGTVNLIDFECIYTSPLFPGVKTVHSGKVYPVRQPTELTSLDIIAVLEETFASQEAALQAFQADQLQFLHMEATSEKIAITPEEEFRPLTAREIRLTLSHFGISPSSVTTMLENIVDAGERDDAITEWEYATSYARDHSLIAQMADAFDLTTAQVDDMWRYGMSITYPKATN